MDGSILPEIRGAKAREKQVESGVSQAITGRISSSKGVD
jgi:hypothetical protein